MSFLKGAAQEMVLLASRVLKKTTNKPHLQRANQWKLYFEVTGFVKYICV